MARPTERGSRNRGKLVHVRVDPEGLLTVRTTRIGVGRGEYFEQSRISGRTAHGLFEHAFGQANATVDLTVCPANTMTHGAGDAFPGGTRPIEIRDEERFSRLHPDRRMTADAEVAESAVRALEHLTVHGVEHGAHLRIGMLRTRPLFVVIRVTVLALARGGEARLGEQSTVDIGCHTGFRGEPDARGGTREHASRQQLPEKCDEGLGGPRSGVARRRLEWIRAVGFVEIGRRVSRGQQAIPRTRCPRPRGRPVKC